MMNSLLLFSIFFCTANAFFYYDQEAMQGEVAHFATGGGSWSLPVGCEDNDCRYVEWTPQEINGEMFMRFTIIGPNSGYIAVAISADASMGNDDAYICSRLDIFSTEGRIQSAYLTGFTFPEINSDLTNHNGSEVNVTDDQLRCTFLRPFNVTKNVGGSLRTWNIETTRYHLLYAEGYVYEGSLTFHLERTATATSFNLVSHAEPTFAIDSPPTSINKNLSIPVESNIIASTNNGGSWLVPNDRCPHGGCKNVKWEQVTGPDGQRMMKFTMQGSSDGWIGMAISSDEMMGDDDCYYCARENSTSSTVHIVSAYLAGHASPVPVERIHHSRVHLASVEDSLMICSFLRPINVTKNINGNNITWDLSQSRFNLFYAEGSVAENGGRISYHSFRRRTNGSFYFLSNEGYATRDASFYNGNMQGQQSTTSTTSLPSTTTTTLIYNPEETVEMSASGGGVWTFPRDCREGCRSLQWEPVVRNEEDLVEMTIRGTGQDYVGFLITTELAATTGDCYFCMRNPLNRDEVLVKSGICEPNTTPTNLEVIPSERVIRTEITENAISCAFYRPLRVRRYINEEEIISYDLAQNSFVLIYEEGSTAGTRSTATPSYSAFTPNSFTLINALLLRRLQAEASTTSRKSNKNTRAFTELNQIVESTTGGSQTIHHYSIFLITFFNVLLFCLLQVSL